MISLAELQAKARRRYPDVLRAQLAGAVVFPLPIRANKSLDRNQGMDHILAQQAELIAYSCNKTGRGYLLSFKPNAKTRQSEISRIAFEAQADYLEFIGKTEEFAQFAGHANRTAAVLPELLPLLRELPRLLLEHASVWPDLLTVCVHFKQHPQPNQYVRNLPLALPTKFIERHQGVLRVLLDRLIPAHVRAGEENFFRRFHLHLEEPSIKIRFLDLALRLHPAVSQCSVWVSEFEQLQPAGSRVYIIENLTTFLSFPLVEDSLAIWGGGFAVSLLAGAEWLHQKQLFYWGDIDVHGFQILNQIRTHFPATQSLLMDHATFSAYHQGEQGGSFTAHELSDLTDEELALYQSILQTNARLEQEKLPAQHVAAAI
ncbi:Wadjet anti-phage system protein JetD domain-containing protein [uncultured Hymenobacter sp.]|uniref:Wadjet anti-phage system protein JetD domain-containing protein n=1 Tax=uncultured Hymenobacter sp. TaxID=170016 RepID=UPI0035C943F5